MEGVGQWRLVEAEQADKETSTPEPAQTTRQRANFVLIAATVALVFAAVGLAIWATMPPGRAAVQQAASVSSAVSAPLGGPDANGLPVATIGTAAPAEEVVVDVQGAVSAPGVHTLPAGSRVADAIAAAGGYAPDVDIAAASHELNLAEMLADGMQLRVPVLGETAPAGTAAPAGGGDPGTGLIDLNAATAEELDTLPGIGPVTAAKIIDARGEAPFVTVDDLLARGVVGSSTFEKIRDLVTVTN